MEKQGAATDPMTTINRIFNFQFSIFNFRLFAAP